MRFLKKTFKSAKFKIQILLQKIFNFETKKRKSYCLICKMSFNPSFYLPSPFPHLSCTQFLHPSFSVEKGVGGRQYTEKGARRDSIEKVVGVRVIQRRGQGGSLEEGRGQYIKNGKGGGGSLEKGEGGQYRRCYGNASPQKRLSKEMHQKSLKSTFEDFLLYFGKSLKTGKGSDISECF